MMNKLLVFAVLLLSRVVFAQEITVYDKITQERIPGAKIYSVLPEIKILSNRDGRFQLETFYQCDSIYIEYATYEILKIAVKDLRKKVSVELSEKSLSISEMTVTGNRWENDQINSATKIIKLDLKETELIGAQTTADIMEGSGYVFVQKSQFAGGSPQIRGFGTNRVMIVVDGVRMNNAIFRSGNLQNIISIDGNSLESSEVMFGPGSVMYGSDAIGGVMNFTQKNARLSMDSSKTFVRTNAFMRYSSAANELTSHLDLNLGFKKWAFYSAASYALFDDLKAGKYGPKHFLRYTHQQLINGKDSTVVNENPQRQVKSGFSQLNLYQSVLYTPNTHWTLKYKVSYSKSSDAPRYDRLTVDKNEDGLLDYAEWYYGPQFWMMHNLSVVHSAKKNKLYNQVRLTIAYQNFKESRHDRKSGSDLIRNQFEVVNALSGNIDFVKRFGNRFKLFYGLEGVFNKVNSHANRVNVFTNNDFTVINSRYPDNSTWQTYGIYSDFNYQFHSKWALNVGGRYSVYNIASSFDTSLFNLPFSEVDILNSALNGSIGLVYKPGSNLQFYTNVSTGFRAPNIDDIGKVFDSEPGSVVVPNINLKPEYAYSGEIGFVSKIKNRVKLEGALYATYLDNALVRSTFLLNGEDSILYEGVLSQVLAIQNSGHAYVYGVQGEVEIIIGKGFSLISQLNYQKGFEFEKEYMEYFPLSHVAPLFGRTSIAYKRRQFTFAVYLVYHGEMQPDDLPLSERNEHVYVRDSNGRAYTPSWYTLNAKGVYYFNKHLSLAVGAENITNQLYRTFGSGISAPGINLSTTLKATF